jgi:hypothetical protein
MRRLTTHTSWMDYRDTLARLEGFTTGGALKGVQGPSQWRWGQLPYEYRDSVKGADYVVYSYSTPIAWHMPNGEWVMPDTRYSVTTSKHQGKIRTAISQL